MKSHQKFALTLLPFAALLFLISETGWAANDLVFYGCIALFVVLQIVIVAFLLRKRDVDG